MNRYQKYVNGLFLAGAAIAWFITQHYTEMVIGYFQLGRRLGGSSDALLHGLPLLVAVATFFALRASTKATEFTTDAVSEMAKVSWPSAKDTRLGTIVVILTVVIAGTILGLLDMAMVAIIRSLIGA